jgi:hypothetical protein
MINIINIINKYGIEKYKKKWKYDDNLSIEENIKNYHNHSSIICKNTNTENVVNILPEIKINNSKVICKLYTFVNDINYERDSAKIIKMLDNLCIDLINNKYKTFELDLRNHSGGNMWPFLYGFTKLFNNSTLFAFTSKKIKKEDKLWWNVVNNEIKTQQKFKSNKINFSGKIIVKIGKNTASTGEIIASMFYRNLDNIKIKGSSKGFLSVNQNFDYKDCTIYLTVNLVQTADMTFHIKEKL